MEKPSEDRAEFITEDLDKLHQRLMLECANAIDEDMDASTCSRHELEDGRIVYDANWTDAEEMRCNLKSITKIDNRLALGKPENQKLWTEYYLKRESRMPNDKNQHYYFNSKKPIAQICNESGMIMPNNLPGDDARYFRVIIDSLTSRPTRKETTESMKIFALDLVMADSVIVALIKKIDSRGRHYRNRITPQRVLEEVMRKEPILSVESVKAQIEIERLNIKDTA